MAEDRLVPRQTYSSPTSFVGSARRLGAWAGRGSTVASVLKWPLAAVAISLVWAFLGVWYVVVFGVFGLFTIPFRLFRRGQRKSLAVQTEQLRTMKELASRDREPV